MFLKSASKSPQLLFLVPQAWTLSIEIMFYILVPFVVRKIRVIALLFSLSLFIRFLAISFGFGLHDPWTYRFFPFELALFFLGLFCEPTTASGSSETRKIIWLSSFNSIRVCLFFAFCIPIYADRLYLQTTQFDSDFDLGNSVPFFVSAEAVVGQLNRRIGLPYIYFSLVNSWRIH